MKRPLLIATGIAVAASGVGVLVFGGGIFEAIAVYSLSGQTYLGCCLAAVALFGTRT